MQFSDWLATKKAESKLTNAAIARACGVSPSAVGKWIKGIQLPERRQVAHLSKLFRVSPVTIMWMTDREALMEEIANGASQQDLAALLAHVPEAEELYRLLATLPIDKRAALMVIARALGNGG